MNTTICRVVLLTLTIFMCQTLNAQTLKSGAYYDRAYGQLQIEKADPLGVQKFSLATEGANGHSCTLGGTIQNHLSRDTADQCFINFDQTTSGVIKVFIDESRYPQSATECRQNCGMRASFDGTYKAKRYEAALQILKVSQLCVEWIHWLKQDQIANDLAITHLHLGQNQECLALLKPFVSAAEKSAKTNVADQDDDGVWEYVGVQPAFYSDGAAVLRSVRTNLRLCGHKFPVTKKE